LIEIKVTVKDDERYCELCGEVAVLVAKVTYPDGSSVNLVHGSHEGVSHYEEEWDGTREGVYKYILEHEYSTKVQYTDNSQG